MNRQFANLPKPSDKRQASLHAGIRYQYLKTILAWVCLKDHDDDAYQSKNNCYPASATGSSSYSNAAAATSNTGVA